MSIKGALANRRRWRLVDLTSWDRCGDFLSRVQLLQHSTIRQQQEQGFRMAGTMEATVHLLLLGSDYGHATFTNTSCFSPAFECGQLFHWINLVLLPFFQKRGEVF